MRRLHLCLVVLLCSSSLFAADPLDNWHHWRGPLANGTAPRAQPPLKWDADTNIAWKTALPGKGSSTPIIWGDRLFVTTCVDTGKQADPRDIPRQDPRFDKKTPTPSTYHRFLVLCLDRHKGSVLWQQTACERVPHEGHHPTHSYAAGSPTTDGKRLYLSFGSHGVYCYDLDGKLLWQRDLGRMETRLGWGEASTPVLHEGKFLLTWDHEGPSFMIALDAESGKTLWKVDRDEVTSWATPLVVRHASSTQVVVPGTRRVRGYDADTGKVLWHGPGLTINCIPSPVSRDGVAFVMAGYRGAIARAVSLDARGDISDSDKVLWTLNRGTPYVPSPVLSGNRLWFTQTNDNLLTSVDVTTGKVVLDRVRLTNLRSLYASPMAAAGRIYLSDRDGTTLVFSEADKLQVLAVNRLNETIDASPVAVGNQLYLRGEKNLYCIREK